MEESRSDQERRFVKTFYRRILIATVCLTAVFAGLLWGMFPNRFSTTATFGMLFMGAIVFYLVAVIVSIISSSAPRRKYFSRILAEQHAGVFPKAAFEFRSRTTFLGLPLVHIRIGDRFDVLQRPVKAWFAMANYAIGGIAAFGGIAVAPVGIGLCGIGLIPFAGIAIGVVPLGGIALGGWTYGALAIGWQSLGCFAIALNAASGNIAIARDYAIGNLAFAANVNHTPVELLVPGWYYAGARLLDRYSLWMNFLWITPLFFQWRMIAKKRLSDPTADHSN